MRRNKLRTRNLIHLHDIIEIAGLDFDVSLVPFIDGILCVSDVEHGRNSLLVCFLIASEHFLFDVVLIFSLCFGSFINLHYLNVFVVSVLLVDVFNSVVVALYYQFYGQVALIYD